MGMTSFCPFTWQISAFPFKQMLNKYLNDSIWKFAELLGCRARQRLSLDLALSLLLPSLHTPVLWGLRHDCNRHFCLENVFFPQYLRASQLQPPDQRDKGGLSDQLVKAHHRLLSSSKREVLWLEEGWNHRSVSSFRHRLHWLKLLQDEGCLSTPLSLQAHLLTCIAQRRGSSCPASFLNLPFKD